ncbi:prepilin-type N-terminal cleavage/methylation domain-containing protein [Peptococcus simiae]|uniref:Prepilin-type N-terminal cleavage/methylation domain-containing protein n=1 Tax=Peptococcus simiae TaxID=1643805 RepID=A0ABW9H149_9FIRM
MKRAVTLPEVLIVLAIMATLVLLLALRLGGLVQTERDQRIEADRALLVTAMEVAAADGVLASDQATLVQKGYLKAPLTDPGTGQAYACYWDGDRPVVLARETE